MLRRFGIWMRVKARQKAATNGSRIRRTYWTGYVSRPSLRRFAAEIGFGDAVKASRLAAACDAACNPNSEVVPVFDIYTELRALGIPGRWLLPERETRACAPRASRAPTRRRSPMRSSSRPGGLSTGETERRLIVSTS